MSTGLPHRLRAAIRLVGAALFLTALSQASTFAAQSQGADERNDPNSPERDAYNQYASSARNLQQAAIEDLQAAVNAAKSAGALDPKDAEGRAAIARRAQDRITSAMNKFEGAAREAKAAARFAGALRKMGITPDPIYDPDVVPTALDRLRELVVVPRHYGPGPETEPDEELDQSSADREKDAINELGQAIKDAQDAGSSDPKDVRGRTAKARAARDHAINALRNFEAARRLARSAEQIRQSKATPFRESVPYGQSSPPPVIAPPYGYGVGGYVAPRRGDEPVYAPDPWGLPR
ncbi:MAG TPA: hypothetical protein VKH64_10600 [Candidatus Binatia bacterium]|nr:hypothetical protein [Candidatus Binatia bacterium]